MGLKRIKTDLFHQGFHRYEERHYETPEGKTFSREVVISRDASVSFVYHEEKQLYGFVKQFRAGADKDMLECVAGGIDEGESPLEAMKRELREEMGCEMVKYEYLGVIEQGPATVSGKLHLFNSVVRGDFEQSLDEDEEVEVIWLTEDEYRATEFTDMKTLILTLKVNKF